MNIKQISKNNIVLLIIAVLIIVAPLILNSSAEYGGADGKAQNVINEINPEYKPWFSSIYEPPSGEIESLIFSVQAALGAGIIGYYLGSRRRK
ncbi:energy-coupling factor ABC transporter substrate-binding protein [Romboutsia sp.]|uniref:energy-coupling factor ABC transporter substrate-binding protein n=1 Tax=Romboutsia sp. TaxID=1965302 RepID=UPI003F2AFBB3